MQTEERLRPRHVLSDNRLVIASCFAAGFSNGRFSAVTFKDLTEVDPCRAESYALTKQLCLEPAHRVIFSLRHRRSTERPHRLKRIVLF